MVSTHKRERISVYGILLIYYVLGYSGASYLLKIYFPLKIDNVMDLPKQVSITVKKWKGKEKKEKTCNEEILTAKWCSAPFEHWVDKWISIKESHEELIYWLHALKSTQINLFNPSKEAIRPISIAWLVADHLHISYTR